MASTPPRSDLLPYPLPEDPAQRLILRCLRRMATHDIRDAQAALMMIDHFGIRFRPPLVLLRAFVAELAQCSVRRITMAPCCAMRMTMDEARLVAVLVAAADSPCCAHHHLQRLTGCQNASSPLSLAQTFNRTLFAIGRPLAQ